MKTKYQSCCSSETGLFIPLFALIVVAAITMMALVIDHSKESLALETLQRAADAAALAGARNLDSSRAGWLNAKKAAVLAIKKNPIHGTSPEAVQPLKLDDPKQPADYWLYPGSDPANVTTSGSAGGLRVTVERGTMWWNSKLKNGKGGYAFSSLEKAQNGRWQGLMQSYLVANAVQVKVTLDRLPNFFGKVIGVGSFDNLTRTALAVSDSQTEIEVAPLAIPYCQLLLDTEVNSTQNWDPTQVSTANDSYLAENYLPEQQQMRELVFTEADPKSDLLNWNGTRPTASLVRREGLTRFESFIRRPYVEYKYGNSVGICGTALNGSAPSCKHLPLYGTIGKPSTSADQVTYAGDVAHLFALANQKQLKARLGNYFAPLQEPRDLSGDIETASSEIAKYINNTTDHFEDVFLEGTPLKAKPNFPFIPTIHKEGENLEIRELYYDKELKTITGSTQVQEILTADEFFDLRLSRPAKITNGANQTSDAQIKLLLDHQDPVIDGAPVIDGKPAVDTRKPLSWTNPLCHGGTDGIPGNSPTQPVRKVRAMVVAPQRLSPDGYTYCDFANVFASAAQRAVPPIAESRPIIVGTVEVYLFDFNVRNLDVQFKKQVDEYKPRTFWESVFSYDKMKTVVTPSYPGYPWPVFDRHPAALDSLDKPWLDEARDKIDKFKSASFVCSADCAYELDLLGNTKKDLSGNPIKKNPQKCDECEQAVSQENMSILQDAFPPTFFWCFDMEDILHVLDEIPQVKQCKLQLFANKIRECLDKSKMSFDDLASALTNKFSSLDGKTRNVLRARPHSHCLPNTRVGGFNLNSADSYEPLHPLSADRGCGGVRGRLVYDPSSVKVWGTGGSKVEATPALVTDESAQ